MAFVNYKNTNNASSLLISDITASATTILITDWDQGLFPSSFPFLLTLEHLDANDNVILREIVKVVANNQNTFTIERSAWTCVQDDTATNRVQDNTAHAFSAWDRVSLYWTAEQVADIQNNLEAKANQDSIANVYDNTATYAVWDVVVYQGDRYTCTTAVSTPEDFDSSKWTKINIQYNLDDQEARIEALENAWWVVPTKVDVLVLWWGWGWGAWANWSWWPHWWGWGWAWWLKIVNWLTLLRDEISVVVWSWWAWWLNYSNWLAWCRWGNWWNSRFWLIIWIWWWGWGWWFCYYANCTNLYAQNWWNWWGRGQHQSNLYDCTWSSTWLWLDWWFNWSKWPTCWWWGWGWVWWMGWYWATQSNSPQWAIWWIWISTCFWWTLRKIWWWGWAWNITFPRYWNNNCSTITFTLDDNLIYNWACFWWWAWWYGTTCLWWDATANTWWGWGWWYNSKWTWWAWWSWLVIVRYPTDWSYWIVNATWWTITTATIEWLSYKIHTFTSWTGTFEITEKA